MKKLITIIILTYLLFTINSTASSQISDSDNLKNQKLLKIGVLLPLSGKFKDIGESFLKAIQLALYDISDVKIKIYPKDTAANALVAYNSAKELEEKGITIIIGPIFHESLERLNEINNVTFISLTNKTKKIPNNIIAFGINIKSQIDILKKYFKEIGISKTLFLSPQKLYEEQAQIITDSKINFQKIFTYNTSPKKVTEEIEKLTSYRERKRELEIRIKILEKSELHKDKNELKELELKHTLGEVNFDSVIIVDFGERLKSVITSFVFSDISSEQVSFFTINQWFDETLFDEIALKNLHFPSIDYKNLKKFKKKYFKAYKENPNQVAILAYDALGLIYHCWYNNDFEFNSKLLTNKEGFKGLHGEFVIENNISKQKLKIYRVAGKKFIKVY